MAALSLEARTSLNRMMFTHVLAQAQSTGVLTGGCVIGRDPGVMVQVSWPAAEFVQEVGCGLNRALRQGRQVALARGAEAILVLPADLPFLTEQDIRQLYKMGVSGNGVVIAPSRDGGTSALLLRPPTVIDFAFGVNSFAMHTGMAYTSGTPYQTLESPTLALDIDHPTDLNLLPVPYL